MTLSAIFSGVLCTFLLLLLPRWFSVPPCGFLAVIGLAVHVMPTFRSVRRAETNNARTLTGIVFKRISTVCFVLGVGMSVPTDPKTSKAIRLRERADNLRRLHEEYAYKLRLEYKEKKRAVQDSAQAEMHSIDNQISSKNRIILSNWAFYGFIIGVILTIGMPSCSSGRASAEAWICFVAVCTVAGVIVAIRAKSTKSLESKRLSIESKMREDMARLDDVCDKEVRIHFEKAQHEYSAAFIGSAVTKEIADYMLESLLKTIRSYDRRSHIKEISVPFSFEVYPNKVMSSYGTYDFKIERVQFLKSMEEQAALAYAIATAIHAEITTIFEVDPSGGEVYPMDVDYQYDTNDEYISYVKASMTYHAANGNFVEARSF